MNFQQLIDKRKFLDSYQEQSLITILCNGQTKEKKQILKTLIQYKFYTVFDQHSVAGRFFIHQGHVEHGLSEEEMKQLRLELLKSHKEGLL